jgi:ubiquinone/menaquinone biosynthesis C-methylase UbiE
VNSDELKLKVRSQFGASAELYATSDVHAKGESLSILLDLTKPNRDWYALDVATGAGHAAFTFAPHVKRVVAIDLTEEMVAKCNELDLQRCVTNFTAKIADAEDLPFDNSMFDLVTCRLALHHFPNPGQALKEFNRVLKPRGVLGFTDNITVSDEKAAKYHNTYEKLRDPSHHWAYSLDDLIQRFKTANFNPLEIQVISKEFEFNEWADRQHVSESTKKHLREMIRDIPKILDDYLSPRWTTNSMYFSLREAVIVAQKLT